MPHSHRPVKRSKSRIIGKIRNKNSCKQIICFLSLKITKNGMNRLFVTRYTHYSNWPLAMAHQAGSQNNKEAPHLKGGVLVSLFGGALRFRCPLSSKLPAGD